MQQLSGHYVHSRLSTHLPCIYQCMHTFTHTQIALPDKYLGSIFGAAKMAGRLPLEFHTCMWAPISKTHANELMSAYCHSSCQWLFGLSVCHGQELSAFVVKWNYLYNGSLSVCEFCILIKLRKNVCLHVCWWVHMQLACGMGLCRVQSWEHRDFHFNSLPEFPNQALLFTPQQHHPPSRLTIPPPSTTPASLLVHTTPSADWLHGGILSCGTG